MCDSIGGYAQIFSEVARLAIIGNHDRRRARQRPKDGRVKPRGNEQVCRGDAADKGVHIIFIVEYLDVDRPVEPCRKLPACRPVAPAAQCVEVQNAHLGLAAAVRPLVDGLGKRVPIARRKVGLPGKLLKIAQGNDHFARIGFGVGRLAGGQVDQRGEIAAQSEAVARYATFRKCERGRVTHHYAVGQLERARGHEPRQCMALRKQPAPQQIDTLSNDTRSHEDRNPKRQLGPEAGEGERSPVTVVEYCTSALNYDVRLPNRAEGGGKVPGCRPHARAGKVGKGRAVVGENNQIPVGRPQKMAGKSAAH